MSHISGYVLNIYLAMPKCNVAVAPNITLELTKILISLSLERSASFRYLLIRLYDTLLTPIVL